MRTIKRVVFALLFIQLIASGLSAQWLEPREGTEEREESNGPAEFYKWFFQKRTFGLGYIPEDGYKKAVAKRNELQKFYSLKNGQTLSVPTAPMEAIVWKNIGPFNINTPFGGPHAGRVTSIAVDPTSSAVAYFGSANGGVWKTTNTGASWQPTSDQTSALAVGAVAIDPQHPNTIYAGTGDYAQGVGSFFGAGVIRSTDGGTTWKSLGLSNVGAFSKIFVHPTNSSIIYAAGAGSGSGLYVTKDDGVSWQKVTSLPPGAITDFSLVVKDGKDYLFAAIPSHGIYMSDDGGAFFQLIHEYTEMRRMHLAVDPANPKDIVDLSISYAGEFEGLSRSVDGGNNWDDISGDFAFTNGLFNGQGWYDAYLRRDPKNPEHFIFGAISIWQTNDGGQSWEDVGQAYKGGIHPDQHNAAFAPDGSLYATCDGGIAYSKNGGSTFEVLDDSAAITQPYSIAIDQTADDISYIGTQDNSTLGGSRDAPWDDITSFGGDGGTVCVDSKDPKSIYFIRPTAFQVAVSDGNGENDFSNGLNTGDSVGWLKPIAQDETNHILYTGSQFLYVYPDNGTKWIRRSKQLATGAYISTICPAGDGTSLMVGTTDGRLWTSANNGSTFTESKGIPARSISDIAVSPVSKTTFYVALSGFGAGHVFKTIDFGANWTNVSGKLPDISANKIVIDPGNPNHLYVATDVGVFYTPNDGNDWLPYGTGLPNIAVFDMALHKAKKVLRVATHGRSVWEAPMDIVNSGITTPTLSSIWYIGEPATIAWYGLNPSKAVKIEISLDDAKTWSSTNDLPAGTTEWNIPEVKFLACEAALIKVSTGTDEVLISQHFKIQQRLAGSSMRVFSEQPLYMYDLAYDGDENTLWVTNFITSSTPDAKIYKMDPNTGVITGSITATSGGNFTGIKYDHASGHLFVNNTPPTGLPRTFELDKTGKVIRSFRTPGNTQYATGILVVDDTLFVADRNNNVIHCVSKTTPTTSYNDFDLSRHAAFGPRCLAINQKTGDLLHTWTDFQGTDGSATLFDSYILKLSRFNGEELSSTFVQEGGNKGTNVRGIEYDPRSDGKEIWVTVLNTGNSSKVMKITLVDGPASGSNAVRNHSQNLVSLSVYPNPLHDATTIKYTLGNPAEVRMVVHDILGREVHSTSYGVENDGEHSHRIQLDQLTAGGYTLSLYAGDILVGSASVIVY